MRVTLLRHTDEPDRVCAVAAATCYSEQTPTELGGRMSEARMRRLLTRVVGSGHHSVLEHAVFTFAVEGVSRAMTHQLVRHRIASYSQQSQRYVRLDTPDYETPPEVAKRPEAKEAFETSMSHAWETYSRLVDQGVPEEDARYVLPNATHTNIVVTMNARELLHFFSLRTCLRAQWEIRKVANAMLKEAKGVAPMVFENAGRPCLRGPCPENATDCPLYPGPEGPGSDQSEGV